MAKVVAELSERRQVIVSTQDEDFVTALESGDFKERGVVHRITAWDGNPTVKTDVPA
jgi:predicted ATPase